MAPRKRARLSEDSEEILEFEDIFAASDAPVEQQIAEWESWRQKVGVRKPSFEKIEKKPSVQSTIACQRKWHYYTDKLTHKSWILTPFLTSAKDPLSHHLTGSPELIKASELLQCTVEGKLMRHYSDIHRVSQLALSHPLVGSVTLHKIDKKIKTSMTLSLMKRGVPHNVTRALGI